MVGTRPQFFDEKSRLFDLEATFLEFQSLDWSHTAYYASIKRVEAFSTDLRSKKFFQVIKKFEKIEKIGMAVKFKKFVKFEKFFRF